MQIFINRRFYGNICVTFFKFIFICRDKYLADIGYIVALFGNRINISFSDKLFISIFNCDCAYSEILAKLRLDGSLYPLVRLCFKISSRIHLYRYSYMLSEPVFSKEYVSIKLPLSVIFKE